MATECWHALTGDYASRSGETAYVGMTYLKTKDERLAIIRWREVSGTCIADVAFAYKTIGELRFRGSSFTHNGITYTKTFNVFDELFNLCTIL